MTKEYNNFKPFRYFTPKPKQYLDIRKHKSKKIQEKFEDDSHMMVFGLVLIVASFAVGTGLIINECTKYAKTLEQKAEEHYQEQIYNLPDYYSK
jgi:hypothetical protein